ncbi:ketoacyl-ACP synthase III [Actinosynnema pretiosum subsp. pretiosum]|uniref:Ketoacyl-ACP synthase III n=1 Tax=Actinosynnema pretiosum subsp. pretiosum TaxID=103721 RepID=A0AA45R757_9PSEU|nr:ketoacyl-ACP synthase III [Actinosynnema pretiosum subsp. pretiosum]
MACRVLATGAHRPAPVDSGEVAARLGRPREWVVERTGIEARCVATACESVETMAVIAATDALAAAGTPASAVDVLVVATSTNPRPCPAVAPKVAAALGLRVPAFDVNVACAGFCYALNLARSLIASGDCATALVVGADRMLDIVDPDDPGTAPVFADGAGALLITATDGPPGVGPVVWGSEGDRAAALEVRPALLGEPAGTTRPALRMDGLAVIRWACATVPDAVRRILAATGLGWDDVGALVPHQANWKLIERVTARLDPPGHVVVADDVRATGNTSAASVPLALHRLVADGRVRAGDWAVLIGFGAGLAYAGQAVRIPGRPRPRKGPQR